MGRPAQSRGFTLPTGITKAMADRAPTPPEHLLQEGRVMWYRLWCAADSHLVDSDIFVVTELCTLVDEAEALRRSFSLGSIPEFYRGSNRAFALHPQRKRLDALRKDIADLLRELELTPRSRRESAAPADMQALTAFMGRQQNRTAERQQQRESR